MDRIAGMKVFVEVVNSGSLSAAAEKLGISRSMATRHVASLEKSFGSPLLYRHSRNLSMTNAGEEILPYCQQILSINDDIAFITSKSDGEPHGSINLACSVSFGHAYVASAVRRFLGCYPKTSIALTLTDRDIELIKERFDVMLQIGNVLDENLVARLIGRCSSIICASPEYLAKHPKPIVPADLMQHNCLTHLRIGNVWRLLPVSGKATDEPVEVFVNGNFSSNDLMTLLDAALDGVGVACLPTFLIQSFIDSGQLHSIIGDYAQEDMGVYLLYPSKKYLSNAAHRLVDFLVHDFNQSFIS